MAKLTKTQSKAHQEAEELLKKDVLTLDDKIFVYENWNEAAVHDNTRAGAFFTPLELANDFKLEVPGPRILDICAGIGVLSFCKYHFEHHQEDNMPRITCVEINPDYVRIGKKLVPEATAVISQATAQKFWPNEDALGKTLVVDRKASSPGNVPRADQTVIIGIVKDVTSGPLIAGPDPTMIYFPTSVHAKRTLTFLIRGKGSVSAATRQLEGVLEATVPNRPTISISLDEMFLTQAYPFWAATWIAAMLGGLALLLTPSGMYGVLSYLVGQRTKEIGIRMALGATPGIVVRLILNQSLKFATWGASVGLALAFGGALLLRHLLTMIDAFDVVSYGSGAAIVVLASLVAAFFPSSRAARINPVETLRAE